MLTPVINIIEQICVPFTKNFHSKFFTDCLNGNDDEKSISQDARLKDDIIIQQIFCVTMVAVSQLKNLEPV